ncbi:flagellin [Planktomarina temperata]|nr:flagellin [Planktomarina temperata]
MTVINTNTASINAQYNLNKVNQEMEKAMEQLSSGKRINSAGDDAAGIAIASRMESQVRGLNQAMRNAADGQSLVDTAEGAMDEISNMLQRMRELALQASNDTNSDSDRESLDLEIDALMDEIDRVVSTTAFNGKNILDGSAELNFQIGSEAGQNMNVAINSMGTNALGSLTGAPAANANLTSSNQGTAAEITEVKMAFSGDDTYSFNLVIGSAAAVAVSGDVSNSSASDITGAINTALSNASLDEYASATFSGGVVTIKDTSGAGIAVNTFASVGSGTGTYSTINGGSSSDEVVTLGGATANIGTTFTTTAATTSHVAAADATSGTAAVFTELLDTSANGNFADVTAWVVGDFGTAPAAADHLEVDFGDFSVSIAIADATDVGSFAQAINAEQSAFTFSAVLEDAGSGVLNYSLKAVSNSVGAIATADIPTIKAIDADGVTITDGAFGAGTALTQTTAGVDAADAVIETGGTKLYLELNGNDDYAFTLAESGLTGGSANLSFSYTGTSASRDSIATQLQTALNAGGASTFSVENINGRLAITNQDDNALTLTAFTSQGTGTILASTDAADSSTQGISQLLDDDVNAVAATTTTAGAAVATSVELSFTADDTYSFKVSDGIRTAVIDATALTTTDASDMEAAINYGLEQAGMDASITVSESAGTITLTQAAGREISVSNFSSDGVGSMLVDAGTGTDGGSSYLNDGLGANASTISSIAITTASKASDAIQVIDRALQDIASERAKLGAVSNRLDHTISNLGNVVINTEASQSRIQDADFAKVTGDLTKSQIMSQAATAMLAQANASKQGVLSLLQG